MADKSFITRIWWW